MPNFIFPELTAENVDTITEQLLELLASMSREDIETELERRIGLDYVDTVYERGLFLHLPSWRKALEMALFLTLVKEAYKMKHCFIVRYGTEPSAGYKFRFAADKRTAQRLAKFHWGYYLPQGYQQHILEI